MRGGTTSDEDVAGTASGTAGGDGAPLLQQSSSSPFGSERRGGKQQQQQQQLHRGNEHVEYRYLDTSSGGGSGRGVGRRGEAGGGLDDSDSGSGQFNRSFEALQRRKVERKMAAKRELQRAREMDDVPSWRYHLRAFFFPKEHRAAMRSMDPRFNVLAKNPDWFEALSLFVIVCNMVALALDDPTERSGEESETSVLLDKLDTFFILFFLVEACVRLLAFGFAKYWSDSWNRLDAVIVVSGCVSLVFKLMSSDIGSITVLRALRVLRPLRSLTKFPSVRLVIAAIVGSLKRLVDVTVLFLLFFMCFSAAAVAQYSRHLRKRCVNEVYYNRTLDPIAVEHNLTDISTFVCGGDFDMAAYNGSAGSIGCSPDTLCGTTKDTFFLESYACPYGYACLLVENPNYGYVGFDNIAMSALTIQVMVTMSSWTEIMYDMMDSTNIGAAVFCTFIIFIGAFFIVNLIVAIITEEFERSYRRAVAKLERERAANSRKRIKVESYVSILLRYARDYAACLRQTHEEQLGRLRETEATLSQQRRDDKILGLLDVIPGSIAANRVEEAESRVRARHRYDSEGSLLGSVRRGFATLRIKLARYVVEREDRIFDHLSGIVMLISTCVLATQYYGMSENHREVIWYVNLTVNVIQTIELTLRFLATHPFLFLVDWWSSLSVPIVALMWVESFVDGFHFPQIRLFRIFIAFPLLKAFSSLYRWVEVVLNAFRSSVVLVFVILLNLFIFATLGMQLYGGEFCGLAEPGEGVGGWCEDRPRANFDAFGTAMLTAFQIMTSDDWQFIMYDAMYVTNVGSAFLFVFDYFVSVYLLNNLFIAILLNSRNDIEDEHARRRQAEAASDMVLGRDPLAHLTDRQMRRLEADKAFRDSSRSPSPRTGRAGKTTSPTGRGRNAAFPGSPTAQVAGQPLLQHQGELVSLRIMQLKKKKEKEEQERQKKAGLINDDDGSVNRARLAVRTFVEHPVIQLIMLLAIIGSTVSQTLASPLLPPDAKLMQYLFIADATCTAIFCLESLLQIISRGFIMGKDTYLRKSWWNVLDFFLAIIGVIDILLVRFATNKTAREVGRLLLPLRPLRILKRAPGIRVVLGSVVAAIPSIKNIMILTWALWALWGIVGVMVFSGSFYSCSDEEFVTETNCTSAGHDWVNAPHNFDNVGSAMTTLYIISTFSDWTKIVYQGVDAVGPGEAPRLNHNPPASIYFLIFAVVGGIFFVNLFVSVLIDTYEEQRKKLAGRSSVFLTAEQSAWMTSHRDIIEALPPPNYNFRDIESEEEDDEDEGGDVDGGDNAANAHGDEEMAVMSQGGAADDEAAKRGRSVSMAVMHNRQQNTLQKATKRMRKARAKALRRPPWTVRLRRSLAVLVQTNKFTMFINVCILLNFLVNAQDRYPIEENWDLALLICNSIFTLIFTIEVIMKVIAFGPRLFMSSKWNVFDLVVVLVSIGGIILELVFARRSLGSSFRTLRLVRLLRLVKATKRVQTMIMKLGFALYALNNVAALIVVVFCVGALLGMRLFARIKWDYDTIDHNANFTEFTEAVLMMLRLATLDNWNEVMTACGVAPPDCDDNIGECGNPVVSQLYFITTTWIFTVVLLNIFVAVIIDTFNNTSGGLTGEKTSMGLTETQIKRFVSTWLRFDPKRTLMVKSTSVIPLLMSLPVTHPFAPPREDLDHRQPLANFRFLFMLDLKEAIPAYVDLWELLSALCRVCFHADPNPDQLERLRNKFNRKNPRFIAGAATLSRLNIKQKIKQIGANLRLFNDNANSTSLCTDGRMDVAVRVAAHLLLERFRMAKRKREEAARAAVAAEREAAARRGLQARVKAWMASCETVDVSHDIGATASGAFDLAGTKLPRPQTDSLSFEKSALIPGFNGAQLLTEDELDDRVDSDDMDFDFADEPLSRSVRASGSADHLLLQTSERRARAMSLPMPPENDDELYGTATGGTPAAADEAKDGAHASSSAGASMSAVASRSALLDRLRLTAEDEDDAAFLAEVMGDLPADVTRPRRADATLEPRRDSVLPQGPAEPAQPVRPQQQRRPSSPMPEDRDKGERLKRRSARAAADSEAVDLLTGGSPRSTPQVQLTSSDSGGSTGPRAPLTMVERLRQRAQLVSGGANPDAGEPLLRVPSHSDANDRGSPVEQQQRPFPTPSQLRATLDRLQRHAPPRATEGEGNAPTAPVDADASAEADLRRRVQLVFGRDERGCPTKSTASRRRDEDEAKRVADQQGASGPALTEHMLRDHHSRAGDESYILHRDVSAIQEDGTAVDSLLSDADPTMNPDVRDEVVEDATEFLNEMLGDLGVPVGGHRGDKMRLMRSEQTGTLGGMLSRIRAARRIEQEEGLPPDARLHRELLENYQEVDEYGGSSNSDDSEGVRARRRIRRHLRAGQAHRASLTAADLIRLHRHRPGAAPNEAELAELIHEGDQRGTNPGSAGDAAETSRHSAGSQRRVSFQRATDSGGRSPSSQRVARTIVPPPRRAVAVPVPEDADADFSDI